MGGFEVVVAKEENLRPFRLLRMKRNFDSGSERPPNLGLRYKRSLVAYSGLRNEILAPAKREHYGNFHRGERYDRHVGVRTI